MAVLWLVAAVVEVIVSAFIPSAALRNPQLPWYERASLAASGIVLLGVYVAVVTAMVWAVGRIVPSTTQSGRWLASAAAALLVWASVLLYAGSWAAFWNAGVFLDREAFAFWAPHPVQVFHWVYPPLAIGMVAVTVVVAFLLGIAIPAWTARREQRTQLAIARVARVAAVSCAVVALFGTLGFGSQDADQAKSAYAVARDEHATPLLHAVADVRRALRATSDLPLMAGDTGGARVVRRPIITMEQYLSRMTGNRGHGYNVVMIQIESLRSDQLRAYGGTRDVMPAIDALAKESRVFTNAYVQASHSNYADLVALSSQYPLRSRQMYEYPENPTYPRVLIYDVLKALGYKTAVISSQNERWGGMINFHRPSSLDYFFHAATYSGPTYTPWEDAGFAQWVKETNGAGSVDDKFTVGEAIQWIDRVQGSPFFLHMNLQSSHVPYVVPEGFQHRFSPPELDFTIMWGRFPKDKIDIVKDRYADSLAYEDEQVGRLFEHLRSRGLWDNTIVIIGGDNGEAFYEHGFAAHANSLFNEVMRVPMVIRAPGVQPGPDSRPAMFLDVPPSILELLGLPAHPGFQGISLLTTPPDADRPAFMLVQTPLAHEVAIVQSGFKLIFSERENRFLLFDLTSDPAERTNIAATRPEIVRALAGRLQLWRREQLAYYDDLSRHPREYPPVLEADD